MNRVSLYIHGPTLRILRGEERVVAAKAEQIVRQLAAERQRFYVRGEKTVAGGLTERLPKRLFDATCRIEEYLNRLIGEMAIERIMRDALEASASIGQKGA